MTRHSIFISDLHLSSATSETTRLFITFLAAITPNIDALYILGDLFKFWVGDDDRTDFNEEIKKALKGASDKIPVYLMPGNRDFLLGEEFAKEAGCILISDPCAINLYGRKTVLTHGDILCTKDPMYRFFRKIIRFPLGLQIFLKLPLKFRIWLAAKIQQYTTKAKATKGKELLVVQEDATKKLLAKFSASQVIHGHVHVAEISTARISLGEWDSQSSALKYYDNCHFELS